MKKITKNRGFSLIEVLIALLVLALGILGISKLQGTLIRNSSDANQRSVASSLAQMKIDDLRSYVLMSEVDYTGDGVDDAWQAGLTTAQQSFAYIATNQGGAADSTPDNVGDFNRSQLINGDITFQNYVFNLSWEVDDYYYDDHDADPSTPEVASTTPSGDIDFKTATVTVTWDNETIALSTAIDAYAPAMTSLADNSSTGGTSPLANYTPEAAPDVIDIGVGVDVDSGTGKLRQTTKPLPDAVKTGADSNTLVTFEVVTYHQNPDDAAEFFSDRNEEFQTVDCSCLLSGTSATSYPPGYIVWDQADKDRYDTVGAPISKATATQTGNANAVDSACTVCCRDHHDATDALSPIKYVDGTPSGDHRHFMADGSTAGAGDVYIESCRFKRIDGVMRVFQDWNFLDLTVMNRNNLVTGDPLQEQYTDYVTQLVKDEIEGTGIAAKPPLRKPINTAVGTIQQLESRVVYIDNVYDEAGSLSSEYASYVADGNNVDRLERVPFADINMTLLSVWSDDPTAATVSVRKDAVATVSDPDNDYYGTYSRGLITAHAAAVAPGVDITASMNKSNDGITQISVNPTPLASVTDTVQVIVAATATNITVTGDMTLTAPGGAKVTMNTSECAFDSGSSGPFTCSYPSGSNVDISISVLKKNDCSGSGTFSQNNVTTTISAGVIAVACDIPA